MSTPELLTFSAPDVEVPKVDAMPSPTLELAYAYYAVCRPDSPQRTQELPWLGMLHAKHPQLVQAIQGFWPQQEASEACGDLFMVMCGLGYARDPDNRRFFEEFAKIPERYIKQAESLKKLVQAQEDEARRARELKRYDQMLLRFSQLKQTEPRKRFLGLLKGLWKALEPLWNEEGQAESRRASELFLSKYQESGSVLEAIPPHHFTQFEASQKSIQASLEKGKLLIVPLFFASGGGFSFDFSDAHYIGYGIQSERLFEKLYARVKEVAPRIKALSDPTRLMMLVLITRYENFAPTVGDLAAQLGVTQPTASGHLKLLKEEGLLTLEKHGNKSYHYVNAEAIQQTLGELSDLLIRPKG